MIKEENEGYMSDHSRSPLISDCNATHAGRRCAAMPVRVFRTLLGRYGSTPEGIRKLADFVRKYEEGPLIASYTHPIISMRCVGIMYWKITEGESLWHGTIPSETILHALSQSELGADPEIKKRIFELCIENGTIKIEQKTLPMVVTEAWSLYGFLRPIFPVVSMVVCTKNRSLYDLSWSAFKQELGTIVIRTCITTAMMDTAYLIVEKLISLYHRYFKHNE